MRLVPKPFRSGTEYRKDTLVLTLYRAGRTPASRRALANVKAICEKHFKGDYTIEEIDLLDDPARAARDQIFALPTLVRRGPGPTRKMIGDMSDHAKVVVGMDLDDSARGRDLAVA
jgi:circadian clock protein KaiB